MSVRLGPDNTESWNFVAEFSGTSTAEDDFFDLVDHLLKTAEIDYVNLESNAGYRALVVSLTSLSLALQHAGGQFEAVGDSTGNLKQSGNVVFTSTIPQVDLVKGVFDRLNDGSLSLKPPRWAGVLESRPNNRMLFEHIKRLGAKDPEGTIRLPAAREGEIKFNIYQVPPERGQLRRSLETTEKIPESLDNLRRREEWFRRRQQGIRQ